MEEIKEKKRSSATRAIWLVSAAVLAAALALFAYWCLTNDGAAVGGVIAAAFCLGLFALGLMLAVPGAFRFFGGDTLFKRHSIGDRSGRRSKLHPVIRVMLTLLAARAALIIIAYIISVAARGYQGSIFRTLESVWLKPDTDAPHYFSIAENGYVTTDPGKYTIVFLPLFPMLIRLFNLVFRDSFTSAMVINTLCSCGAAALIYELALCDTGRRSARFAVIFTFALPAAIFFAAPMSEALFLLLSSAALLALRKDRFWLAAVFGALASFTRSAGIIMAVPFAAEAVRYAVLRYREKGKKGFGGTVVKLAACLIILLLGTFAYLLVNKLVFGEWFKFVRFQRENWYQEPGLFFNTTSTQFGELVKTFGLDNEAALGLWLPNLLYVFGALLVFIFTARTLRTSYTLYFAAYFAVTCGATWLLSAPRYLTALVVIPLALAHLCESRDDGVAIGRARAKTAIVTSILLVSQLLYLIMYIRDYSIY
ncbi:MAG: hypothetical protein J5586_03810 [Clostridia bacterium]|nr:hypothetical protein [Clostridia bacterium]